MVNIRYTLVGRLRVTILLVKMIRDFDESDVLSHTHTHTQRVVYTPDILSDQFLFFNTKERLTCLLLAFDIPQFIACMKIKRNIQILFGDLGNIKIDVLT